ncbi:MAG: lipopolysaccharide biosynthesis protein [Gemmatimonadaceae bacterium]
MKSDGALAHALRGDALLRRVVANGAWLIGASGVGAGLGAVQSVIVARALGVQGFGTVGLIVAFVNVVGRLTSSRMHEFVIQYVSQYEAGEQSNRAAAIKFAVVVEVAAALCAYALLWLTAPLGARWFVREPDTVFLIRLYGLSVLAGLVSETSQGVLQLYGRYRGYSLASAVGAALSLGGVVAAVVLERGIAGVLIALLVGAFATGVMLGAAALVEVRRRLGVNWWAARLDHLTSRWRAVLAFVSSTNVSATLSMIAKDGDVLWLGLFRGPAEAGLFRLAFSLCALAVLPIGSLVQSIYPELARQAARKQWAEFGQLLRRGTGVAAMYIVPVFAGVGLLSVPLIEVLVGRQFVPAAPALIILLVGTGASNLFFWARPALLALHRPDYQMRVAFALVAIKLIGVVVLVPITGYLGSATLAAAIYLPGAALCVWKVREIVRREQHVDAPMPHLSASRPR